VTWPARVVRSKGPHKRLDDFLPEYQFRPYHQLDIEAERVAEAAREVSFADMPAAAWLMRIRDLAGGNRAALGQKIDRRPILDMMARPGSGFLPLDVSNPREIVYGMAGRPWTNERPPRVANAEEFLAFTKPGHIRVSTETRTLGNDEEARRVFARYWRLIYPGSAIIRGVWLEAIAAKARG
jgi:hypothetical protein